MNGLCRPCFLMLLVYCAIAMGADPSPDVRVLLGHDGSVTDLAYIPNGSMLASTSHDKTIKIWDPQAGNEIRTLTGHTDGVRAVAFSPDGKVLASCSVDKTIRLWDASSFELVRTLEGHTDAVRSVAF